MFGSYDMNVYLSKDRHRVAQHLTATHATVTNLTMGYKDLAINCTWTTFPLLTSLMTWPSKTFLVVGL